MSKFLIKIYVIAFAVFLVFSFTLPAEALISSSGPIVPCGRLNQPLCNLCHIPVLIKNLIDYMTFYIAFPLAAFMFVVAGYFYLIAGGSSQKISQAKTVFTTTVTGLGIVLLSWLFIAEIMIVLNGGSTTTSGFKLAVNMQRPWNELPSPTNCSLGTLQIVTIDTGGGGTPQCGQVDSSTGLITDCHCDGNACVLGPGSDFCLDNNNCGGGGDSCGDGTCDTGERCEADCGPQYGCEDRAGVLTCVRNGAGNSCSASEENLPCGGGGGGGISRCEVDEFTGVLNGVCSPTGGGEICTSNAGCVPTPRFGCNGGQCVSMPNGAFFDDTCDNTCAPPLSSCGDGICSLNEICAADGCCDPNLFCPTPPFGFHNCTSTDIAAGVNCTIGNNCTSCSTIVPDVPPPICGDLVFCSDLNQFECHCTALPGCQVLQTCCAPCTLNRAPF